MPQYRVAITEVVQYLVPVEAPDAESAEQVGINILVDSADRDQYFVAVQARDCDGVNLDERRYALLSSQGTACPETVLYAGEYTAEARATVERKWCGPNRDADSAIPGTWTDVTENDACR